MKNVVYSIFGKDVAEAILEVNYKYEDMYLTGVVEYMVLKVLEKCVVVILHIFARCSMLICSVE